jgi:WD40 repeat protein
VPKTNQQRDDRNAEADSGGREDQSLSGMLAGFVEQACSLAAADGAAIAVRDAQGIFCQASTGNAPPIGSRLPPDSAFTRECFESGQMVVCQDAENDPRIGPANASSLHLRSALAVPIQAQGSVLGVVEVFSSRPSAFDGMHIAGLRRIAESIAPVLSSNATESPIASKENPVAVPVLVESPPAAEPPPSIEPAVAPPKEASQQSSAVPSVAESSLISLSIDHQPPEKKGKSARSIGIVVGILLFLLLSVLLLRFFTPLPNRRRTLPPVAATDPAPVPAARRANRDTPATGDAHLGPPGDSHPVEVPSLSASRGEIEGSNETRLPNSTASSVELASKHSSDNVVPTVIRPPNLKPGASEARAKDLSPQRPVFTVEDAPPGANIFVDDQFAASTDLSGKATIATLRPGQHNVRVTIGGYQDYEQNFDLRAGQTSTVTARLQPVVPPALAAARNIPNVPAPLNPPVLETPAKTSGLAVPATTPPAARPMDVSTLECELIRSFEAHSGWVTSIAFSADGQRLASGGWDETVKFWEVPSGEKLSTVEGKIKRVEAVAFSRDGRWLAAENSNYAVTLWDATTGQAIRTLTGSPPSGPGNNWVYSIAFSPDGRWLAAGVDNKTIRVWDVTNGRPMRDLAGSPRSVIYIAFSPDGRWLASGGDDKTIKIWDVTSGREIHTLSGHKKEVYAVAFSPDGRWLASASKDKSVKIWDAVSGREVRTLNGHRNWVTSVAFSPDSSWLASGSWDNTVKIWNVQTGRDVQTLSGQGHHIYAVAFDPGEHWLASGREDGKIEFWKLEQTVKRAEFDNQGNH